MMFTHPARTTAALAATAALGLLSFSAATARAELIYGVTTNSQLFTFDSASPGTTLSTVGISNLAAGQVVAGFDIRPATGGLFVLGYNESVGSGPNAQLYSLGTNGMASPIGGALTLAPGLPGARMGFDFNPVPDRIRVIFGDNRTATGDDANYRLNPNNGVLAATDQDVFFPGTGDPNSMVDPIIAGAAYTNNFAGATSTTLYAYDFASDDIVIVTVNAGQPNDGQLTTVGDSVDFDDAGVGFDISGLTGTAYLSGRVLGANNLYTVDLATGNSVLVGQFGTGVSVLDIAVVPEPGTYALFAVGLGALAFGAARRRRATVAA